MVFVAKNYFVAGQEFTKPPSPDVSLKHMRDIGRASTKTCNFIHRLKRLYRKNEMRARRRHIHSFSSVVC